MAFGIMRTVTKRTVWSLQITKDAVKNAFTKATPNHYGLGVNKHVVSWTSCKGILSRLFFGKRSKRAFCRSRAISCLKLIIDRERQ